MSSELTARISRLGPAQRELFESRLDKPPAGHRSLGENGSGGPIPASPTQRSMWFVHQLEPEAPALNNAGVVRIRGPLDIDALEQALAGLIRRHEVLRTTYQSVEGELTQIVNPVPNTVLERRQAPGSSLDDLREEIDAEVSRPFDLESDLMYRSVLYRLGDDDHVLVRTSHHIAFDRWSVAIANRELSAMYRAGIERSEPDLPDLAVQYRDFASWQLANLAEDTGEARLRFFTSHIAGVSQSLDLTPDRRSSSANGMAAAIRSHMSADRAREVRELARRHGATPFMVLLAAFGLVMGRYARTEQLLIGVPVALRSEPELANLVGPFINTVALRLDLRGDPSFAELIERVRRTSLNMMAHQDLPFDQLVKATAPERETGHTPLFQVMFDYLNTPHADLDLPGLELESLPLDTATVAHDLTLYVHDLPGGIESRWEYRTDRFDRATVGAVSAAFDSTVRRLVASPQTPASCVGLLDEMEESRVRAAGSGPTTRRDWSHVLEPIERQRRADPDALAIESIDGGLTYEQLAVRVNGFSSSLVDRGIGSGDTVALGVGRSIDQIALFLGILAVGARAVLLDPAQPGQRLQAMLDVAEPDLVVADGAAIVSPHVGLADFAEYLRRDDASEASGFTPVTPISGDDPAYVVFTSGSSGSPKGVVVGHESMANFVYSAAETYHLGENDRVLQFASPGFDTFIEEVLPALTIGATVVLRPTDLYSTFADFASDLEDRNVTVASLPTAWWHAWVDDLESSRRELPGCLRVVVVGGEAARASTWRAWSRLADQVRWINSYGPSEATVVVATFEPPSGYRPTSYWIPLGRPIPNTTLMVVDPAGQPLPPRLVGELVIEGDAVALGYLGADGHAFGVDEVTGRRRYRTGDLARLLADGTIEFVGRSDSQMKVRGTRVEPVEIENVLREHPDIVDAVVVPDDDGELIGHLVTDQAKEGEIDLASIRQFVSILLPEAMVPGGWRVHESIPMTPSGKQDRRRLERMGAQTAHSSNGVPSLPRSDVERKLASIWENELGRSGVSITDSFFDLGGHSLLGVRMVSKISSSFDMKLPLRVIFETPTIESMAKFIEEAVDA